MRFLSLAILFATLSILPRIASADETAPERASSPPRRDQTSGGIGFSGLIGVTNSSYATDVRGLRLTAAMPLWGRWKIGPALSLEQHIRSFSWSTSDGSTASAGSAHDDSIDVQTAGLVVGIGAPWSDGVFGFSAEAGAAHGMASSLSRDGRSGTTNTLGQKPSDSVFFSPYAQGTLVAQLPLKGPFRPWVAASARWMFLEFGDSSQSATLQLGVSWLAW